MRDGFFSSHIGVLHMKFNRSDLLTQVRKGGYTGEADPAKVKSFLAGLGMDSENIEVPGDDGKPTSAKFDDVWAKTATLALPSQSWMRSPKRPKATSRKSK